MAEIACKWCVMKNDEDREYCWACLGRLGPPPPFPWTSLLIMIVMIAAFFWFVDSIQSTGYEAGFRDGAKGQHK